MRCSKLERGAQRVMELINFHSLSASEAVRLIRDGTVSSEQLVEACLARIREVDERVQAWAFLDPDHALAQARAADAWRSEGRATGPLHGVRLRALCRPHAFPRCHRSCKAARGGGGHHGEDRDD